MTGSYNFTTAARLYNQEHGIFLGAGHEDNEQLRSQLEARWNRALAPRDQTSISK
jgi:hypothetical protein